MKKNSFPNKIEQILRFIAFLFYFFATAFFIFIDYWLRPLYPKINKWSGGYFGRNFKMLSPIEYIVSYWERGLLMVFGIDVIVDSM